jgi:DNA-binding GntR family transcriptional regulator
VIVQAQKAIEDGESANDIFSWEEANQRFHRTIISTCQMPKLLATIDDLHLASARFLFSTWKSKWETRTEHDHRTIIRALKNGDLENAAKVLERHVRLTGRKLSTFL